MNQPTPHQTPAISNANTEVPHAGNSDRQNPPHSPKAVLSTSREEFYGQDLEHNPLELIIKEGLTENQCQLPDDLQGHVFIVGAVGYINSYKPDPKNYPFVVEPANDGEGWTSLINGEGMIYRLDFHQTTQNASTGELKKEPGKAWMATRIVKTPDYYADTALETKLETNPIYKEKFSSYEDWFLKFRNFGLTRVSLLLGARNYLNTAFLPMKFSNGSERLLVTWDVGRPYEIDPCTLGLVAPIGWNKQWQPLIKQDLLNWVFTPLLSAAHPVFDRDKNEMFTVNGSKSLGTILGILRLARFDAKEFTDRFVKIPIIKNIVAFFITWGLSIILEILLYLVRFLFGIQGEDFLCLTRWNGSGTDVKQWQVLDENNQPLRILQSLHQMGITENYTEPSLSALYD
ncbi:carotenoid oxygenase family protein [Limnofasciculus baicalensis]|uniref:Carotenoid oxygenase family protein n=1 Tax=Limnofasciculus baicalensis BBK-W-15 TaxID=2699891 RepID=A0AAE3GM72_9CYAN|nr:carotenoid oxygenase family protein [Limnofasciculus baicalensis]MCP2726934.1 carotenoid oxygenase family protein [Limnofasciculus baicalensis BBK-W-15]